MKTLKILLDVGGIVEIIVGILFISLGPFMKQFGIVIYPIFIQIAGAFFFCYGILLIYSSRNIEQYVTIPIINILLRLIVIVLSIFGISMYLEFLVILLFAMSYDLIWSVLVLVLLKRNKIILKKQ
jgi:hypothetical protein